MLAAKPIFKALATASPTPEPSELHWAVGHVLLTLSDILSILGVIAAGITLRVVFIQLGKMNKQTEVMEATKDLTKETRDLTDVMRWIADKELVIVETQTNILHNQHQAQLAREARRADLVLFSDKTQLQGWANRVNPGYGTINLSVHNFGNRTCTAFRIIIGIPLAYDGFSDVEDARSWTFLNKKPLTGLLMGYQFLQRDFEQRVYPRETIQFYRMDLIAKRDSRLPAPMAILWSVIHEDGVQPSSAFTYFEMTASPVKSEKLVRIAGGLMPSGPETD